MNEYIVRFDAEDMGTRLIAVVNGKKAYIADKIDGKWVLNDLGRILDTGGTYEVPIHEELGISIPADPVARRRGRPPKVKPDLAE